MSTDSPYISKSKHPFTSVVEDHFFNGAKPDLTGQSPMPGTKYTVAADMPFNTPDTGVNYVAPNRAGHTVK